MNHQYSLNIFIQTFPYYKDTIPSLQKMDPLLESHIIGLCTLFSFPECRLRILNNYKELGINPDLAQHLIEFYDTDN